MEIKNKRLLLRKLSEADLEFMYNLKSNHLVYLYEEDEEPGKNKIYIKYNEKITRMKHEPNRFFILLVVKLPEETPIGEIHIHLDDEETKFWEIGYALHPDYWGHGYATDAAKLLIKYTFEKLNANEIMGCCNGNNKRSANCMERAGMKLKNIVKGGRLLRGERYDEYVYSVFKKDYYSQPSNTK